MNMNDKATSDKIERGFADVSPISRRKPNKQSTPNNNNDAPWFLMLLWGWVKKSGKDRSSRVADKYETVLYPQPEEDSKEIEPADSKIESKRNLTSYKSRSSYDEVY